MLAVVLITVVGAQAQSSNKALITPGDTLTNATSASHVIQVKGSKTNVVFQVNVKKISGTVGGYVQYAASIDTGANYKVLYTDTLANSDQVLLRAFDRNPYSFYKITVTTTGTQKSVYVPWVLYRE